jgi:hypothetical protein
MLWIRPLMPGLTEKLLLCFALAAVAAGCKPQIGDDCKVSTDCSAAGDRLCDITAPGGYCTVFNCEPNSCPDDESLCVQFGAVLSPVCAGQPLPSPSPYARTFCMATCKSNSDCRSGYVCEKLDEGNPWGAVLMDTNRGDKACLVPFDGTAVLDEKNGKKPSGQVCGSDSAQQDGEGGSGG